MKIVYYSYTQEIIENIEAGKVHIFPKSVDKNLAKDRYMQSLENQDQEFNEIPNIFLKQPKFMGLGEFKTNLFLSDEMVLREEKQVIAFYRSLSLKNRKELGVESYYDVIDIAANFLNFFKLLKEYKIEELKGLRPWQEKIYKLFLEIKDSYLEFLKERNYTDPIFVIEEKNYTSKSLCDYKEIIIYNKFYFSRLEKWVIKKLEEDGFEITLKLQLNKSDFCEETLSLKELTLVKDMKKKIDIFTVDDDFTGLLKVLDITQNEIEEEKISFDIFDTNHENYKYNQFFNNKKYISEFPIFTLLDGIHKLLSTLEIIENEIAIELHTVVDVIKWEEIIKYYDIKLEELEGLKKLVNEGYKYLTKHVIGEKLEENHFIMRIFEDIEEMKKYKTLKEWLEKITFDKEKLIGLMNENSIGKYFEALSEIAVIENLDIVDEWNNFFEKGKKSEGLLKLILKYLEFKEVKDVVKKKKSLRKSGIENIETKINKHLLLMNTTDKYLPKKVKNTFLFTEQQKKDLGIKGAEEDRLEEKYNVFRAILTSESSTIIGIKNLGDDSSLSPFVEELIDVYKLKPKHIKQSMKNYIELIKPVSKIERVEELPLGEKPVEMKFELEELTSPMRINAYMCGELFNCKYKMNLRYLKRLNKEELEVEKNLTLREYGILAHELFESVLNRIRLEKDYLSIENGNISRKSIMNDLEKFVGQRRLKLPKLNEKYYKEIVYKNLVYSVEKFFKEIASQMQNEKIIDLMIEKNLKREIINKKSKLEVLGVGKADLIIKTDKNEYIIDFKTGKLNEMQLDFYSILHGGESNLAEKYIFNVDKGNLEKSEVIKMVKDEKGRTTVDPEGKNNRLKVLQTELEEFLKLGNFDRKASSGCNRCDYIDICKVGELDDE
jgi:hypothetical protein